METTIVKNQKEMISSKDSKHLAAGVYVAISKIQVFIEHNEYPAIKNGEQLQIDKSNLIEKIQTLSLSKRKILRNYLWVISNYPSIQKINKFLHFLATKILKTETRFQIVKSDKQLCIEEKRKKYIDALAVAKKAQAEYKEEKSDFYKLRLAKDQKI